MKFYVSITTFNDSVYMTIKKGNKSKSWQLKKHSVSIILLIAIIKSWSV